MKAPMRKRGRCLVAEWDVAIDMLSRFPDGSELMVTTKRTRSTRQNRMWHAGMDRAFEKLPERFDNLIPSVEALISSIKIAAGHCRLVLRVDTGEFVAEPLSTSFDDMEQPEFNAFLERAVDALQKHVFPEMTHEQVMAEIFRPRNEGQRRAA